MRRITTALIGLNEHSHSLPIYKCINTLGEYFDVKGYVLPENERERLPEKLCVLEGYPELTLESVLNDKSVESVIIETDEVYLTDYAIKAAKAGKHVYMEKPGGTDLAKFEELISLMKQSGKVFQIGYMYRYNPMIKDVIARVKAGEFGEITSVEAQMNCIHKPDLRNWLSTLPGGMMFYLGCHLVDLVLQICGKPEKIIPLNRATGVDGIGSTDLGLAVFEYKNGSSVIKTSACEYGGFMRRRLAVCGTKGSVEICPLEVIEGELQYTEKTEYFVRSWHDRGAHEKTPLFDRYRDMLVSFAKEVAGETVNPYTPDYELELYKILLKTCGVK